MENVRIMVRGRPKLESPVFLEGLPGVGNVGKLAIEHLVDELQAKPLAEVFSKDFPPQVFVGEDGTVKLVRNQLFYAKRGARNKRDLILLTGDYQGLSAAGQYDICEGVLRLVKKHGVKELYTLGGYGLGRMVSDPAVLGAATDLRTVERLTEHGVEFREDEPGGGIIGASGLFLGLGMLEGMHGACLMGETSGYLVDPVSARAVLDILAKLLELDVSYERLDEKAQEMDKIAQQLKEMERKATERAPDDLRYIG